MPRPLRQYKPKTVALLAEGVDRNSHTALYLSNTSVALLAEGVDRNFPVFDYKIGAMLVALLAEGVDRNFSSAISLLPSLVALLAEGVDRNVVWYLRTNH